MKKVLQALIVFLLCMNTVSAATWYVRAGGSGNGTSAAAALSTISAAINAAANGDVIDIGPGTFAERLNINKSLELRGSNAGTAPWSWSQPATVVVPPSTNFETTAAGALAYVEASGVKIDGIEFNGVNNSLSDASPLVIHGENARASRGIIVADTYNNLRFLNNRFRNFTTRGIAASSNQIQTAAFEIKDSDFDNITGVNNIIGISVVVTNHLPQVTGNRFTRTNFGVLLQYSGIPNVAGTATASSNQISAYEVGIAVRGFSGAIAPANLLQNNTIERANYDQWSADGLTKPTGIVFTGIEFSNLLGDNSIRAEGNTIKEARSAIYLRNVVKSATNPDRVLLKSNTHINSQAGVYIDDASTAATRTVVESSTVRNSSIIGMEVRGNGTYENELVLRNGVVIEHPAPLTDNYTDGIFLSGPNAVLAELNDTKISSAKYNFIAFDNNAMSGKVVDGSNVTYDGTVRDFTFSNYKPSAVQSAALRTAVKERIVDGEDESNAGSGIVQIQAAANTTWYVRTGGNGNGTSTASPFGTIAAAINAASTGDVINIGAGTFAERLSITKALELRGNNAGTAPWNWAQPATVIVPPTTDFTASAAGALANVTANGVKIDGIEFNGVNNTLNDANPQVINGVNSRAGRGILVGESFNDFHFVNNRVQNIAFRGLAVGSSTAPIQTAALEVKDNAFDNITATNNGFAISVLTTNHVPQITGNRFTRANIGILVQYSATPNVANTATVSSNQVSGYQVGIAVRGFQNAIAPAHLVQNNTVARGNYDQWSADGLTKPTNVEFTGVELSGLQGNNNLRAEGNTISDARSAVYVRDVAKSATNPDRLLLKNNTHINSQAGLYLDDAAVAVTRVVVESSVVRNASIVGMEVRGNGAFENELVLRNGVVIEHPAPLTDNYGDGIYLSGSKAVLAELNDTKISSAKFNFITFHDNAMAGKEVNGNNVTYDGTVRDFTFNNYKPSETQNAALRTAVKERIQDGEDAAYAGSGIVRIATVTASPELAANATVQVYPNPSRTGQINITFNGSGARDVKATFYNLNGQVLLEKSEVVKSSNAVLQLQTNKFPKGLYLLKLTDGAVVTTKKVVLE